MRTSESGLRTDETGSLIAADKVEGTRVYDKTGEDVGTVKDVMLDKVSGRVCYVVLSSGGILGIGDKRLPLPWSTLHYDVNKGGYITTSDRATLSKAPAYGAEDRVDWADRQWGERVHRHYGVAPYWGI